MIVDVPYLLVGQGIPPQKRTLHSCLVADRTPIEIREATGHEAPLALQAENFVVGKGGVETFEMRDYRWLDGAMWVRSSEMMSLVPESRPNYGFGAVHNAPAFPEAAADLRDAAALGLFERRRSIFGGWAAPMFMIEGSDDIPKKRSEVYRTRAEFDAAVSLFREYRVSEQTEKAIAAARDAAQRVVVVDGQFFRRVPMPQLIMHRSAGRVVVSHQTDASKGAMTWPVTKFEEMAASWRSAGNDSVLIPPAMTVHLPDLFDGSREALKRLQKAATLIERHMGDKLKRGDTRFFEAFAHLRDEIEREGSIEALQEAMCNAWATLRDYPQFEVNMPHVGVYERVDEAFGDRLRGIAENGLVPAADLDALSAVGPSRMAVP